MPRCQWCDQHLNKRFACRLSRKNWRSHYGPIYFCNTDHRENWLQYHDPADGRIDEARRTPLDIMADESDGLEYGEWPEQTV